MTKKLFYEDSYKIYFKAEVITCQGYKENYAITLNQTAFYPEGGGQPSDQGTLGNAKVTYVFIREGIIYHIVDKQIEIGQSVTGEVDFKRRFDYMQQHTGEHIISGLVKSLYGYNNVGFHLSKEYMTADFDGEFTKEELMILEERANTVVFNNVAIIVALYPQKQLEGVSYRSKIQIEDDVRLVTVTDCDVCACCGTHLKTSGEIGLIKILSAQKHRGGTRLTIVCGLRALKDYNHKLRSVTHISSLLSAKQAFIVEAVEKQQEDINQIKQQLATRTQELFEFKAMAYIKQQKGIICVVEQGFTAEELRRLCRVLIEKTERICLVLTVDRQGVKYALGCSKEDIRSLCKTLNKTFNGCGGGKDICQGSLETTFECVKNFIQGISI